MDNEVPNSIGDREFIFHFGLRLAGLCGLFSEESPLASIQKLTLHIHSRHRHPDGGRRAPVVLVCHSLCSFHPSSGRNT